MSATIKEKLPVSPFIQQEELIVTKAIEARYKRVMNAAHWGAYLLHPVYDSNDMTEEETEAAVDVILAVSPIGELSQGAVLAEVSIIYLPGLFKIYC